MGKGLSGGTQQYHRNNRIMAKFSKLCQDSVCYFGKIICEKTRKAIFYLRIRINCKKINLQHMTKHGSTCSKCNLYNCHHPG